MPNRAAQWKTKIESEVGAPVEVIERHRRGMTFALPDGRRRLVRSLGEMHLLDGATEIDTDLDTDSGGFVAKARRTDFGIRFTATAGRRLTPRPDVPGEYVTVGRPSRWTGTAWVNYTPSSYERVGHQILFRSATAGDVRLSVKATRVATEVTLASAAQNVPWRWPFTLTGLAWTPDGDSVRIVSLSDGQTVMWMRPPSWEDAALKTGPVVWSFDGSYVTYQPPDLTDAVFPVTIDPDFTTQIAASADDGYVTPGASTYNNNSTSLQVGYDSKFYRTSNIWLRFANITIAQGSTVSDAHIHFILTLAANAVCDIWCVDEDDHAAPTTYAEWNTDHGLHDTESTTSWTIGSGSAGDTKTTPSFDAHAQHIFARANWTSGYDLGVHLDAQASGTDLHYLASYDNTTYAEPDLDITYTPPTTTVNATTISRTVEIPAPTIKQISIGPTSIGRTVAIPTAQVGINLTAATISRAALIPTVNVGAGATAVTISRAAVIPTAQVGLDVTATSISRAVVIPTPPTIKYGTKVTATTITRTALVTTVSIWGKVEATPITRTVLIPTPPTLKYGGKKTATTITRAVVFPTAQVGIDISPASISRAVVMPRPQVGLDITATPIARAVLISTPPTIKYGASKTPLSVTLLAVAINFGEIIVGAGPASISRAVQIPTPTIKYGGKLTLSAIDRTALIPTINVGAGATAVTISRNALISSVTQLGAGAGPATISRQVIIPTSQVGTDVTATSIARAVVFPTVQIGAGARVTASTVSSPTTLQAVQVSAGTTAVPIELSALIVAAAELRLGATPTIDTISRAALFVEPDRIRRPTRVKTHSYYGTP